MQFFRLMPLYVLLAGTLFFSNQNLFSQPVATAIKIKTAPVIDGEVLDDPVWKSAVPTSGFWQTMPEDGQPASEKTEVRILYTENAIYFGVVCYDREPQNIIVSESRRDASLTETDGFQIVLDTFFDKQNAFLFGTNPAGIEYDAQITNEGEGRFGSGSGGFNLNWDGSWEVRTKTSKIGWSAEFEIPFRTLRFASGEKQTWGLNFQRNIRRRNERVYWSQLPRQFNVQKISLAGTLTGLENIHQNNLKFMPYALGDISRDFLNKQDTDKDGDFGFDVKYSVTPSLTLDATYNTDFAQVEVDELQINLDRFNLFFPEKRPFFLENAGSFSVGSPGAVQLFFSRRIGISEDGLPVPILGGLRFSGKMSNVNIGILNMQTDSVADTVQANNFSVVRINKELPNRSAVGALFVNRQGTGDLAPDNDYNRTIAVDGRFGIGRYGLISGFAARTFTPGFGDAQYAFNAGAEYNSVKWLLVASYTEVAENFNPEVGFLRRSGFRSPSATIFRRIRPENFLGFLELRPHISYSGFWNFDGFQESGRWHIDNHWEWKNGYEVHTAINFTREGVTEAFEIFPGNSVQTGTYDHAEFQLLTFTNRGAWWSFRTTTTIGGFFGGDRISFEPSLRFRLGETFNTEFSLSHNDINLPGGDFVTNLFRARVSYSFTPRIFLQGLVQLNDLDNIGSLNLRFGWQQTANTGLFVVYNDSREITGSRWDTQFRSVIAKYSHLFDLLK